MKLIRRLLVFLLIAGFAGGIAFISITISQAPSLSQVDITPEGYLTTILDREGETLTTLAGVEANRVYVKLGMIPEDVRHAFVAIEDARFYSHHGIDLRGIGRALVRGVRNGFHFTEGASTITQQLLKNNVFSGWMEEKTIWDRVNRKLQEQVLAVRLETRDSKDVILENYLNTINLGGGTWGVQAASKRYYGKDVSTLTLSEAAVIAGITKNPSAYNPIEHPEACRERQELVLRAMKDQGYITQEACDEALADDVFERIARNHTGDRLEALSYFEDALVRQVLEDLMKKQGYSEAEAWDKIYRGGLTICSTADAALQTMAEEEINNDGNYTSDAQASLVLMDVKTGAVRALVGGRGEKTASLLLNRAITSERQPGSTLKIPGEYAAGLEKSLITLGTAVDDAPMTYTNGQKITNADKTFHGMTTVEKAIVNSWNIPALKIFQQVGMDSVWNQLRLFGITTLTDEDRVEPLALGGTHGGVTNLEMTAAYNAIANEGVYILPYYYTRVLDHDGSILLETVPETHTAVSAETAALLTAAMEKVISSGTGTDAFFDGCALAGKSGTTTGSRDVWFVGYTTELTCGVWGGYDDNREQESGRYVRNLWRAVMQRAVMEYGAGTSFPGVQGLETVKICGKCGKVAETGLCDRSLQGDTTEVVAFAPGTSPTTPCTCHVEVRICTASGQVCSRYCPTSVRETRVYLKEGTAGTLDEPYVVPASEGETCQIHAHFWDSFAPGESLPSQTPGPEERPERPDRREWWDSFMDWFR